MTILYSAHAIMDKETAIRTIRRASQVGYTATADILTELVKSGWVTEDELLLGYEILKSDDDSRAVAFFQLPYATAFSLDWLAIEWPHGAPSVSLTPKTKESGGADRDATQVLSNQREDWNVHSYTQVAIAFHVWGRRLRYYDKYLTEILRSPKHNRAHLVVSAMSWVADGRPLSAETYESDLASRLHHESVGVMRSFIDAYSVLCRDPYAGLSSQLSNFFVMMKNGRLVVRPKHEVINVDTQRTRTVVPPITARQFLKAIAERSRFSDYERFLVDAIRHIDSGHANVAVVQAVMILDWFANTIIADQVIKPVRLGLQEKPVLQSFVVSKIWESANRKAKIRVRTLEKFKDYFPVAGIVLTAQLFGRLEAVISLRNAIVHQRQIEPLETERAYEALETAMLVVRESLSQLKNQAA